MSDIEEIKNRINLVDLIQEYTPLKKAGVNFKSVCPFHEEKTPSFVVSPSKQIWHCFGCGFGGDIFEFIKQIEGVEFREALQILAKRAGVTLIKPTAQHIQQQDKKKVLYEINALAAKFFAKVLSDSPQAKAARDYLQKRGFKPETIQSWQIGYAPDSYHSFDEFIVKKGYQKSEALDAGLLVRKGEPALPKSAQADEGGYFDRFRDRIMFPITDIHGRVVGFTARIIPQTSTQVSAGGGQYADTVPKYVNSPETLIYSKSEIVFGLDRAKSEIRKKEEAIVVEGNVDVITAHEAGFINVVGSSGTALTQRQLTTIKRFSENLSFAFDTDEAGLSAARRGVEQALKLGFNVKLVSIPAELAKDPDELIRKNVELWKKRIESAESFMDFYFQAIFAKLDLAKSIDKKTAARELVPLIALLPDEIDRSHYIQKIALKLGVGEEVISNMIKRAGESGQDSGPAGEQTKPRAKKLSKMEVLERRVLGLLLKFPDNLKDDWQDFSEEDFQTPELRKIFVEARAEIANPESKPTGEEPNEEVRLLIFGVENELSQLEDWNIDAVKREFVRGLKQETLKRRMRELSGRIQLAESEGRRQEASELSGEFNNLSKELNSFSSHNA